jgi:hypothetical protein
MAMSWGTRSRRRVISWRTPRASRSLAQNAAVGRRRAAISAIWAPAARPEEKFTAGVSTLTSSGRPAAARTPLAQLPEPFADALDRGDQDPLDPLLLEQVEVAAFALGLFGAVAEDHRQPLGSHRLLDPAGDVGEEGVGHVQHDQAEGAAAAGPQRASGFVAHEPEGGDGLLHPGPGWPARPPAAGSGRWTPSRPTRRPRQLRRGCCRWSWNPSQLRPRLVRCSGGNRAP